MTPALGEERGQAQRFLLGRRDLWASLLIGLCCLLVYNANRRAISAGDTYPARYLPFAIWQYHTVLLDPIAALTAQGRGDTAFWMVPVAGGHTISQYPVVLPVLVAPLYLPAVGYLRLRGWTEGRLDHVARVMEKLSASLVAALSASLLYLLLRRRAAAPVALLLTLAYAFGTTTWVIGSQALWQHGMAELLVICALLLLTGPCTTPRAIALGLLCGLIAGNRPPDVILAAALGAYGLFWAGRSRAVLLAAAAVLPMVPVLLYNLGVAGHFAGGYGLRGKARFFQHDLLPGLGGVLLSPTRGLLVFSPFLLFLVLAWRHPPRSPRRARPHPGDERRRRPPGPALRQGRLAIRHLLGGAVHDRPPPFPPVDAGAGGRRAARLRPDVLPDRGRRRDRRRGHRRLLVHRRDRPRDLRRPQRPPADAGRVGLAERALRRVLAQRPRAGGADARDARQS